MLITIFQSVSRCFRLVESGLLVGCLFMIIILTVLQIILRNFLSFSISWVEPLNQHLVLVIAFLGAMVAGRNGEHITFDIIQRWVPGRFRMGVALSGSILSAGVCFALAYLCADLTYQDFLDPIPAFGVVPQWVFELIIPVGFFVIGYRILKVAIQRFISSQKNRV